jgi:hypothetical protein
VFTKDDSADLLSPPARWVGLFEDGSGMAAAVLEDMIDAIWVTEADVDFVLTETGEQPYWVPRVKRVEFAEGDILILANRATVTNTSAWIAATHVDHNQVLAQVPAGTPIPEDARSWTLAKVLATV